MQSREQQLTHKKMEIHPFDKPVSSIEKDGVAAIKVQYIIKVKKKKVILL